MLLKESSNYNIKKHLAGLCDGEHIVHAYIFTGGSAESRRELSEWFSAALLCEGEDRPCGECLQCRKLAHGNHEDVFWIDRPQDGEYVLSEQILDLIDSLKYKPYGLMHIAVINDADYIREDMQNKLLKTLEEPRSDAVIMLLCSRLDALLPTVRSRCSVYMLDEVPAAASEQHKKASAEMLDLCMNNAAYYEKKACISYILNDKDEQRSLAADFLEVFEDRIRNALVSGADTMDAAKKNKLLNIAACCEKSHKYLKQVHNVSYTMKQFCLEI